jgi:hypothetical protein
MRPAVTSAASKSSTSFPGPSVADTEGRRKVIEAMLDLDDR